ncbi:MAG: type II secretion system protein [Solirubrobacteraceae bacterium]
MLGSRANACVLAPSALKQRRARAETRIEDKYSAFVMIRTNPFRPKQSPRRSASMAFVRPQGDLSASTTPTPTPRWLPPLGSERGDTLIEVVISAALISLVVIAVLFGLDSTNRATANSRARSQADGLAQQDEERLRSEPIKKLTELERKENVTVGATTYTITTTAKYIADATGTQSCSSSVPTADYLKTISTVTWPSMGPNGGVIETGVISPPADSALIVRVEDVGAPLADAKVVVKGPAPSTSAYELETSVNGCAIFALSPGEYAINVSKTGYVDPNGYANTSSDESVTKSVYLPAETTSKEGYYLAPAGKLAVSFTEGVGAEAKSAEGDSFVIFNTGMAHYQPIPETATLETYAPKIESSSPNNIFPFTTNYTVYAGTCEADLPTRNGQSSNPEVLVPPGGTGEKSVLLAPIDIKVLESKGLPEKPVPSATVMLEDTGCKALRKLTTTSAGALSRAGMPFGTYSLCVTATVAGKQREDTVSIDNDSASGTPLQTIYLGEEGKEGSVC